jgi:hypothetical protein
VADIEFYDDIFEPRFCQWLLDDARANLADGREFNRSNFNWPANIVRGSAAVLVREYRADTERFIILSLINRGIIAHGDYHVMNYAWTRYSYIPWHNDGHRKEALTIYLNQDWDPDWGGLFLYQDPDQAIRGFAPKFNCGLKNTAHVRHCTTMVTSEASEPRFTLQLFAKPD